MKDIKYPEVNVGPLVEAGSYVAVINQCRKAIREAGLPGSVFDEYIDEAAKDDKYGHELHTTIKFFDCCGPDEDYVAGGGNPIHVLFQKFHSFLFDFVPAYHILSNFMTRRVVHLEKDYVTKRNEHRVTHCGRPVKKTLSSGRTGHLRTTTDYHSYKKITCSICSSELADFWTLEGSSWWWKGSCCWW